MRRPGGIPPRGRRGAGARPRRPCWETFGPPLPQVNAVAVGPDELTVYAGGADYAASQAAIFKSADGGRRGTRSCRRTPASSTATSSSTRPARPRSTPARSSTADDPDLSHGRRRPGLDARQTIPIVCGPRSRRERPRRAAVACGTRFFHTPDAGLTWDERPTRSRNRRRLTPGPGSALYAYGASRIFRSTNGGRPGVDAGDAPDACPGILSLRVDPANAQRYIAGLGALGAGRLPVRRSLHERRCRCDMDGERSLRRLRDRRAPRPERLSRRLRVRELHRRHPAEGRSLAKLRRRSHLAEPGPTRQWSLASRRLRRRDHSPRCHALGRLRPGPAEDARGRAAVDGVRSGLRPARADGQNPDLTPIVPGEVGEWLSRAPATAGRGSAGSSGANPAAPRSDEPLVPDQSRMD